MIICFGVLYLFTFVHTDFEILEAVMVSKVMVDIILQWPACKCKMLIFSFHYINFNIKKNICKKWQQIKLLQILLNYPIFHFISCCRL